MWRLAFRNLGRHRVRSLLTAGGMAVGVAMLIFTNGFAQAQIDVMIRGATSADLGQARVSTAGWADRPSIYRHLEVDDALLDRIAAVDGVAGAAPRVRSWGLVGTEARSMVAKLNGVNPSREVGVTRVHEAVIEGRWLEDVATEGFDPRPVVLGHHLARQLQVGVGDELVAFMQAADGALGNDLLMIVGIVDTGNSEIDRSSVFMHIDDLRFLTALEGRAHEIALGVTDLRTVTDTTHRMRAALDVSSSPGRDDLVVMSWGEILPQLWQMVELSRSSSWVLYLIVYSVVALGVLNTQRMSAIERRREFGVMVGIGLHPRRLAALVMLETVLLSTLGGVFGAILGGLTVGWFSVHGLDFAALGSVDGFTLMGVSFDNRLYMPLTLGVVLPPVVIVVLVGTACGLWPAMTASRIDAVRAIGGRT